MYSACVAEGENSKSFFRYDQVAENYMLSDIALLKVTKETGIVAWLDACSDLLGSNACAPFYYSAFEDCTVQNLEGISFTVNPPFKDPAPFVAMCEKACKADS